MLEVAPQEETGPVCLVHGCVSAGSAYEMRVAGVLLPRLHSPSLYEGPVLAGPPESPLPPALCGTRGAAALGCVAGNQWEVVGGRQVGEGPCDSSSSQSLAGRKEYNRALFNLKMKM